MLSFTELSTLIPVSSGFSGLASRFVEDAFGFALGWTYWISVCLLFLPKFPQVHSISAIIIMPIYQRE
ncbi:AIF_HP2_G0052240.mRNA.1.CDS.1 [Saccharomyces cerevisiae]|nr:AIF_HP2_G0052240.mRNA.1.CDS.1 [Saccharomyces cerevisiae]CAI6796924.1 AIF_HP2_G0052240.mRNA.1.CDS.1 [Saccharomyces cerevisiae]